MALPLAGGGELAPQAIEEPKQTSAEPMEIDQGSRRIHEKEDAIDLDFSGLDRKQTQISTASEYDESFGFVIIIFIRLNFFFIQI